MPRQHSRTRGLAPLLIVVALLGSAWGPAAPSAQAAAATSESVAAAQMDGGGYTTCTIRTNKTLWCWGNLTLTDFVSVTAPLVGQNGRNEPQQLGTDLWLSVSVGSEAICGIKIARATDTQGSPWCMGANRSGRFGIESTRLSRTHEPIRVAEGSDWTTISVGGNHLCGIRQGNLWCGGENGDGELGLADYDDRVGMVDTGNSASALTTGQSHTCFLAAQQAYCMGYNIYGQLGDGTTTTSNALVSVSGTHKFSTISAGRFFTCAIAVNSTDYPEDAGRTYCWGVNEARNLGSGADGDYSPKSEPTLIQGDLRMGKISAGADHTCAITTAGALYCWGSNSSSESGAASSLSSTLPVRIGTASNWSLVATSDWGSCAATAATSRVASSSYCWGDRISVGNGTQSYANTPTKLSGSDWLRIAVNGYARCGIRGSTLPGTLWCWGVNSDGIIGSGTEDDAWNPVRVGGAASWASWNEIALGSDSACGITSDTALRCWGNNRAGQLGLGDTVARLAPTTVGTETGWSGVSIGDATACAIKTTSGETSVWCWGSDSEGRVGNGPVVSEDVLTPTEVIAAAPGVSWKKVSVGATHVCALEDSGKLWCWGNNTSYFGGGGLLGDGTTDSQPEPVRSIEGMTFTDVAAGFSSTCAIATGGMTYCWGWNIYGSLGNGDTLPDAFFMMAVPFVAASAGGSSAAVVPGLWSNCSIKRGGDLYCWGFAFGGLLPLGRDESSPNPTKVGSGFTSASLATGLFNSSGGCGIKSDQTLWCWGAASSNFLQNGLPDNYAAPQLVKILYRRPTANGDAQLLGRAKRGATITADAPSFSGTPLPAVTYQWYRCTKAATASTSSVPSTCTKISGATGLTYVLKSADVGRYLRVAVVAKSKAGTITILTRSTARVAN